MGHILYVNFGYHVNNFFTIASLSGTPEDLIYLIEIAHEAGLFVLIDIVHNHASSNVTDGFNNWDEINYLYFNSGPIRFKIK